jgi:mycothiol synthase
MKKRPYSGDSDIQLLQDFNAAAIALTNGCGYLHPGDIPHYLFNGNKFFDPADVLSIWEDDAGVAAWLLVGPRHKAYDAQIRPDLRGNSLERTVLMHGAERLVALMQRHNIDSERIYADAFQCDTTRSRLLFELGWELEARSSYILNRALLKEIGEPVLPEGFRIRSVRGVEEAPAVAGVHLAAFEKAEWTPELYRKVMESPGYAAERELVVEAPDGILAAFTVTWYDELNKTGYFEPVGVHKDYQRRGLGKALLFHGMRRMVAAGMKFATVANFSSNIGARELYKSCGFKPWHALDSYSKPVST